MKKQDDEFLQEDLDDEKTVEFIKSYLPHVEHIFCNIRFT